MACNLRLESVSTGIRWDPPRGRKGRFIDTIRTPSLHFSQSFNQDFFHFKSSHLVHNLTNAIETLTETVSVSVVSIVRSCWMLDLSRCDVERPIPEIFLVLNYIRIEIYASSPIKSMFS